MDPSSPAPSGETPASARYTIEGRRMVSIEHPGVIRNLDEGLKSLGGSAEIAQILNPPTALTSTNLYLHPEEPMSRPITSTCLPTDNLVLKITVPKCIGRKRKGGGESATDESEKESNRSWKKSRLDYTAQDMVRHLKDTFGKYKVDVVGHVDTAHTFRAMPDFVTSTTNSRIAKEFRENIFSFDYPKMKEFNFDPSKGVKPNTEIIPPPRLTDFEMSYPYYYRQNPAVKTTTLPDGQVLTVNVQEADRVHSYLLALDTPKVPTQKHPNCPPLNTVSKLIQDEVAILEKLFVDRPIWTRRALVNIRNKNYNSQTIKHALAYLGYYFRSGPWRDCIIKFGLDPRTDPNCAKYQSIMFKLDQSQHLNVDRVAERGARIRRHLGEDARDSRASRAAKTYFDITRTIKPRSNYSDSRPSGGKHSYIFTGLPPYVPGTKTFQICDIQDPLIMEIVNPKHRPAPLRSKCDFATDGWFAPLTITKARIVMRHKLHLLMQGCTIRPPDSIYDPIVSKPDFITDLSDEDIRSWISERGAATVARKADGELETEDEARDREMDWYAELRVVAREEKSRESGEGRFARGRGGLKTDVMDPRGRVVEADDEDEDDDDDDDGEGEGEGDGGGGDRAYDLFGAGEDGEEDEDEGDVDENDEDDDENADEDDTTVPGPFQKPRTAYARGEMELAVELDDENEDDDEDDGDEEEADEDDDSGNDSDIVDEEDGTPLDGTTDVEADDLDGRRGRA